MSYTAERIHDIVENQRTFFHSGETLDVDWRIQQLKKLKAAVLEHENLLQKALYEDLGKSPTEAYLVDIGPVIVEINEMAILRTKEAYFVTLGYHNKVRVFVPLNGIVYRWN